MAMGIKEAVFQQRINDMERLGKTTAERLDTLLDLLAKKNGLTVDELEAIRQIRVI